MRPLFACWSEVAARLAGSPLIALFLDFDGTLASIEARPEMVRLHPGVHRPLTALAGSPRFRVWVISARRRADVCTRVGVSSVRCLGLYGWERDLCGPPPNGAMRHIRKLLTAALPVDPAIRIEDKQHTIAVHYRGARAPARDFAARQLRRAVEPWSGLLRISPGKCVWEILPRALGDKGAAVRRELAALPCPAFPVYAGDDLSDEPAFASVPRGLAIRVGPLRLTRAQYRLNGPADVARFLEKLEAEFV